MDDEIKKIHTKLFGGIILGEEKELNTCPSCGNQFKRFIGEACTMTCFYKNIL